MYIRYSNVYSIFIEFQHHLRRTYELLFRTSVDGCHILAYSNKPMRRKHTSWIPTLKLIWKCVTRWSILFICNTFSCWLVLLSFLYIEFAVVRCTNPDNVNCFGTIFPNLEFVFASIYVALRSHAIRPIQKLLNCQTTRPWRTNEGKTTLI